MKQEKFGEASRVLREELIKDDAEMYTTDQKKANGHAWTRLAHVHHFMFVVGRVGTNRDRAQTHLETSMHYATQKAFLQIRALEEEGEVTRKDIYYAACVNPCVQILEDLGEHIRAQVFKNLYLSNSQQPSSSESSRMID